MGKFLQRAYIAVKQEALIFWRIWANIEWRYDDGSKMMRRRLDGVWSFPARWEYRLATAEEVDEEEKARVW